MNVAIHPGPETIAALAEGKLPRHAIAAAMEHVDGCRRCAEALAAANDAVAEEQAAAPRRWWIAAAAVIAIVAAIVSWRLLERSPMEGLVALAPRSARTVEPRLCGGFPWAAYRGPDRTTSRSNDPERLKLAGAAGDLIDRAQQDPSAAAQHAAGVAEVLIEEPLAAEERLRAAAERTPDDAAIWSDLAAARYAAAMKLERPSLLPQALAAADRAIRLEARRPEALFNRALILERMNLRQEARSAWTVYLAADPSSPWATEARAHLDRLGAAPPAAASSDPQQSRKLGESVYPSQWAAAVLRGEAAEAKRLLALTRTIGETLAQRGEMLALEAAETIERSQEPAALARAYALYRDGRVAYSRQQLGTAQVKLAEAAKAFARLGSPMALAARYYAANVQYDRNEVAAAREALARVLDETPPRYVALTAEAQWELALCDNALGDHDRALRSLTAAEAAFTRLGENGHAAFMRSLLASTLMHDGRRDESWTWRVRSFAGLDGRQRAIALGGAARMELRAGWPSAALSLLALERDALRGQGDEALLANALMRSAMLRAEEADAAGAASDAAEAARVANRIADPALRNRARADADLAAGAVAWRDDPHRARATLTRAIEAYTANALPSFLPECFLIRARAAARLRDSAAAAADLDRGIAALGEPKGDVGGSGMLAAASSLFREAIALAVDHRDARTAFVYAEKMQAWRGAPPVTDVADLQRRLAGSGAAVLAAVMVPDGVATICVTADEVIAARMPLPRGPLEPLVRGALAGEEMPLRALHDALIAPAAATVAKATALIVVADELLERVPFAALRDAASGRALVESIAVALTPSAGSLQRQNAARPRSVLAVALASGQRTGSDALPEAAGELEEVRSAYRSAAPLPRQTFGDFLGALRSVDVVHVAGHTEREAGAGEPSLLFDGARVSWRAIAATRSAPPVVVLAACETLRRADSAGTRALSLAGGFVAAGARDVIGTLAPIGDADARALFAAVHRHLARGEPPAAAVRLAQLEAISARRDAWRAVAVLTTRIPEESKPWVS